MKEQSQKETVYITQ